jgi:hypothetical protein
MTSACHSAWSEAEAQNLWVLFSSLSLSLSGEARCHPKGGDPLTVFRFAKPPLPQGARERPRQRQSGKRHLKTPPFGHPFLVKGEFLYEHFAKAGENDYGNINSGKPNKKGQLPFGDLPDC